ncbi:benzoate 4-monooxygenase cytochrome p450 [Lasallia pustulata]|uniref:Benzoate 4-monooxygenase cytochrome p450 n=1 Tax=Lasallia pustulata TaxID=136370 RepID=A0A1W5CVU1_9LECA|nr:benzoate 4-monooxygenase cytochrome p450 [Lasallia pustulata]
MSEVNPVHCTTRKKKLQAGYAPKSALKRLDCQHASTFVHIFDTSRRAIRSRSVIQASKEKPTEDDMLDRWLRTKQEHPESHYDEMEIETAGTSAIGAGADTTSAALQAFFYHLLRSPEHLDRLRQEIDTAQSQGKLSKIVSYEDVQELPFLRACVQETYRMHPSVSFPLPRVVQKGGLTVDGRHFAEGTSLCIHPWVIHRSEKAFDSDAKKFNPTRWLGPKAKALQRYMVHWGKGYNMCPGQHLADIEITKITATLIRDYDFELVNPEQE